MKIHIAIVDPKTEDKFILTTLLNHFEKDRSLFQIDCYDSLNPASIKFDYDVYIIDMHIQNQSPLQLATMILEKHNHAKIIFTSYKNEDIFTAMQSDVFYFVRKCYLKEDVMNAIRKYIKCYQNLQHLYICHNNGREYRFSYQDIMYFEVYKNTMYLTLANNHKFEQRKTMKKLMEEIQDESFYRIHESYYINLSYVSSIDEHQVKLINHVVLPISKRKYKQTKEALRYYRFNHPNISVNDHLSQIH